MMRNSETETHRGIKTDRGVDPQQEMERVRVEKKTKMKTKMKTKVASRDR